MIGPEEELSPIEEETTQDGGGTSYRPEGNEADILREYRYVLDARTLTEGLLFQEEEVTACGPSPLPGRPVIGAEEG